MTKVVEKIKEPKPKIVVPRLTMMLFNLEMLHERYKAVKRRDIYVRLTIAMDHIEEVIDLIEEEK